MGRVGEWREWRKRRIGVLRMGWGWEGWGGWMVARAMCIQCAGVEEGENFKVRFNMNCNVECGRGRGKTWCW